MSKVTIVAGLPGSGKTFYRQNDPILRDQVHIDIQDVYADLPDEAWGGVMSALCCKLQKVLRQNASVVVEGCFLPGSQSLNWLKMEARRCRAIVDYVLMDTPVNVCRQRILDDRDSGRVAAGLSQIRLNLLERLTK